MPSGLLAGLAGGMQGYSQGKQKETDLAVNLTLKQLEAEADAEKEARIAERASISRKEEGDVAYNRQLGLISAESAARREETKAKDTATDNKLPSDAAMIEYYATKVLGEDTPKGRQKAAEWVKQSRSKGAEDMRMEFISKSVANGVPVEEAKSSADELFKVETPVEQPPIAGARKAKDGNWYVQKNGKWHKVD